jgi:flagellar biosynthesis protein FlhG
MIKTRTISITSGKGGVGKSTILSNMALSLARRGKKVLILDGDLGMANVDIMFGVRSHYSIYDVIRGDKTLDEVIVSISENISLVPGGSGVYGLHNLDVIQKQNILDQVSLLEGRFDYFLIDTAPGIADNVLYLNSASEEICVVLTPDPASLADSYALIKVLNQKQGEKRFNIICNMVKDETEGMAVFKRLSDVASKFLYVSLDYKGFIPLDLNLRQATKAQQLIVGSCPAAPSAQAMENLVKKMSDSEMFSELKGGMQFFWRQLSGVA